MRNLYRTALAATLAALAFIVPTPAAAQPVFTFPALDSIAASSSNNTTGQTCLLVKYRGTTAGKPTVEVAAGGDVTFKIAGSADTTTGWDTAASANGIFDLSTPDATIDTYGEFVNLVNTLGSNWVAVLAGCLASDLTNNTITTISATEAGTPKGVALTRDSAVASATSVFSAQVALVPTDANTNISFFLSGSPVGSPTGSTKVNTNPFARYQTFVTHARENITSSGTVALFEVLAVNRTYDSLGKVSETVRVLYAITGAATTVELVKDFHNGPLVSALGELIIVRQRTATDLTASQIAGSGYMVRR